MPGQANPYAPTLGDILPYVQQDTKSRVNAIDFTNEINTATNFANQRMAENERERVAHRKAMQEAYASVDPSKLEGTLENDKPILMEKIMGVLDILQNDPEAISNPNSKGYVDFQKNYLDAMKTIQTSKFRKLKATGDEALLEKNPDFKTATNKTKIDWYKNNFDANPDEVNLAPELISVFPIFDALKIKTKQDAKSVQDFGNGRIDEITTTSYPTFEQEAIDAYSNVRYADGEPLGVAFERDIYSKLPQSEKDKYPDPFDYYKQLVSEHKPADVITGQNAQALETTDTYRAKEVIQTEEQAKRDAEKNRLDIEKNKAETTQNIREHAANNLDDQKYKATDVTTDTPKGAKISDESLRKIYETEAASINNSELPEAQKSKKIEDLKYKIFLEGLTPTENAGRNPAQRNLAGSSGLGNYQIIDGTRHKMYEKMGIPKSDYAKTDEKFKKDANFQYQVALEYAKELDENIPKDISFKRRLYLMSKGWYTGNPYYNDNKVPGIKSFNPSTGKYEMQNKMTAMQYAYSILRNINDNYRATKKQSSTENTSTPTNNWDKYKRN